MRISDWSSGVCSSDLDRVLLLLVAVLISIGLIAVAAASPAAGARYSGGNVTFAPLYYFYRQLMWIIVAVPVMVAVSMLPKERARRLSIAGAVIFTVLLFLTPILGQEVNGARRWIGFRSEEHTSELQSLMRISYAVFC